MRGEFEKAVRMGHLKGIKPKETPTPAAEPTPSVISETPHQITISPKQADTPTPPEKPIKKKRKSKA